MDNPTEAPDLKDQTFAMPTLGAASGKPSDRSKVMIALGLGLDQELGTNMRVIAHWPIRLIKEFAGLVKPTRRCSKARFSGSTI